jgi:hypothetical protein
VPIDGWRFVGGLGVGAAALFVASFTVPARRCVVRWAARVLALVLAVTMAAAGVNMHYDYFPTLAALLGRRAADQVSMSTFHRMEQAAQARYR